jgi:hypothetical protein
VYAHISAHTFCPISAKLEFFSYILVTMPIIIFIKLCTAAADLCHAVRWTDDKANIYFFELGRSD